MLVFGRSRSGSRGEGAAPRQRYVLFAGISSSARGPKVQEAVRTGSRIDAKKKRASARNASFKTLRFRSRSYTPCGHGLGRVDRTGGSRALDGRSALWFCRRLSAGARAAAPRLLPHTAFRQPCDASTHFSSHLSPCTGPRCAHPRRRESLRAACRRDDAQKEGRRPGPALRS